MANSWFRMYHEFATDPKVQMMSEAMQRRLVMLFCIRCSNDDETFHETELVFQLRISEQEWAETKRVFIQRKFIDEDCNLLNWDERQYRSDSSTARVKAFRERQKKQHETQCNVSVTPQDTDTDSDIKDTNKLVSKKRDTKNAKRAIRLPEDWKCSPDLARAIHERFNLSPEVIQRQEGVFFDYWIGESGAKARKLDWDAAFRVWCSRVDAGGGKGFSSTAKRGGGSQGAVQQAEALQESAARLRDMGPDDVDPLAH